MTVQAEAESRRKFATIIREVRTEHFEKGMLAEDAILADAIAANERLWRTLQPILARDAALEIVKRVVKGTPLAFDGPQQKLFEDLPQRITTKGGGWKPINKATVAELRWHIEWCEKRLEGNLKRSSQDSETVERLRELLTQLEQAAGKNAAMRLEDALNRRRHRQK